MIKFTQPTVLCVKKTVLALRFNFDSESAPVQGFQCRIPIVQMNFVAKINSTHQLQKVNLSYSVCQSMGV